MPVLDPSQATRSALTMDTDQQNLGNSPGSDGRGRLHTFIANSLTEPIPVFPVDGPGGSVVSVFNEITAIVGGSETPIITYTIPVGQSLSLNQAEVSGNNVAIYNLYVNNVIQARFRSYWCEFDGTLGSGLSLNSGDTIKITVIHSRPDPGDFEARIQGTLV